MIIPGFVISAITFPGVAVHELAHQICCRICRIPVYEVKYFRFQNPCGYVLHEPTGNPWKNLITGMGPFFVNTILGMIITLPAFYNLWGAGRYIGGGSGYIRFLYYILYWLGLSVLMHAFPSTGDAKSMIQTILKNKEVNIFAKIVTAPFIALIYLGAIGSMFWLDLVYGIAMSAILPVMAEKILLML